MALAQKRPLDRKEVSRNKSSWQASFMPLKFAGQERKENELISIHLAYITKNIIKYIYAAVVSALTHDFPVTLQNMVVFQYYYI